MRPRTRRRTKGGQVGAEMIMRQPPPHININAALRRDPSRTGGLRQRFIAQMDRRWNGLKAQIRTSIVDRDCFNIQPDALFVGAPTEFKQFRFTRTEDKIAAFMKWLEDQEKAGILELTAGAGGWTDRYVQSAYAQGVRRSILEMRKRQLSFPDFNALPGGMASAFLSPIHADALGVLYTRVFSELKTVAELTNQRIRRSVADGLTTGLTRGLAEGKWPITIARELMKDVTNHVDVIGRVRARMIARTEIIRAHHVATIQEYRQAAEDMQVEVMAEFSTSGDDRVCDECAAMEGKTFSLDVIEGMIPRHPNCRCAAIPAAEWVNARFATETRQAA